MNVQQIIDGIKSTTDRYYEPGDSMRWPFQVGMLETKLREFAHILNIQTEHIRDLEQQLIAKEE